MKCHYEILGLEISCTADELKKAYRKLALEWHPDKNLDRLEEAKENFQLIQQAYDILSDPQERAWYDRHRDDILRGGAEQTFKDDALDVYQYFNTSCFKGYSDDEKGFYTVYRQVFEKLTAEDKPFMDEDDELEVPQFGYSYSAYEEVHNFYAYWQSYCTAKSFSWEDKFDLTEARRSGLGRQMIRAMEKENKKNRDQHKKLRNEEVRELVAFVRKRDKRVQAQKKLMEEMKAEKAKKAEELRRKKIQERNKTLENYEESEWNSMSQFENHFNEIESALDATFGDTTNDAEDDEMLDLGELYCVACEKDFRSEKAFKNHENSKKHKDNVLALTQLMEEEEEEAAVVSASEAPNEIIEENLSEAEIIPSDNNNDDDDDDDDISSKALLDELIKNSTKSKKKKKKGKAQTHQETQEEELETSTNIQSQVENLHISEDSPITEHVVADSSQNERSTSSKATPKSASVKKKSKKEKGLKNEVGTAEKEDTEDSSEKSTTLCGTCNNNFPSRNKLFEHLKQTGHAVYKGENSASSGTGKKNRKKKL